MFYVNQLSDEEGNEDGREDNMCASQGWNTVYTGGLGCGEEIE